jgi:hypothetical protein
MSVCSVNVKLSAEDEFVNISIQSSLILHRVDLKALGNRDFGGAIWFILKKF